MTRKIIVRAQNPDEEFNYLIRVLEKMPFYNKYGYKIPIPDHPFFLKISNNLDLLKKLDMEEARDIFRKEVYDFSYFKNGLKIIEQDIDLAEKAIKKMKEWKRWGFKLFSKYEVRLTAFGPGGSYDLDTGSIIMKISRDGRFKRIPATTIVHEIIHIGIEECIVKKFKLTHLEKEGIVDAICANYFKDVSVDYIVQNLSNKTVFNIVSKNSLKSLLQEVKRYKAR